MSKADDAILEALHAALPALLLARIQDGSATASDMAVAAKFLKDNGVSRLLDKHANDAGQRALEAALPPVDAEPDDYDDIAHTFQ